MVKNRGVFQMNDAPVRARFQVPFYYLAVCVVMCSEIIAHSLFFNVEILSDTGYAAMGQCMLDATKFFKCDVHKHKYW